MGSPVWSREHVLGTMAKKMEEMLREREQGIDEWEASFPSTFNCHRKTYKEH